MAKAVRKPLATGGRTPRPAPIHHALPDFDPLIHEKTRLSIVSALAVNPTLTFSELKTILKTTDGNVSVHARKLEEANYLTMKKSFEGRVPRTVYSLTTAGRKALDRYLDHMEALIRVTRRG
ncbi:MAG: transcriptional regulator [Acidobacteriota bacterium]